MGAPWRAASLLVRDGAIGEIVGVTHLHDKPLPPLAGTPFDDVPHMLLTDYLLHWVDITRTWLPTAAPGPVDLGAGGRLPGAGPADEAHNPWSATLSMATGSGATATLRITGSNVTSHPGCPFWVHGTTGTLRGSVLLDSDRLELDDGTTSTPVPLTGAWFVDGSPPPMGELMCAVAEDREPENSAADAARSVRLVLAARDSAERGGVPCVAGRRTVPEVIDEVPVDPDPARVYAEGWQSWSPATGTPPTRRAPLRTRLAAPDAVPPGGARGGRRAPGRGAARRRPRRG